VSKQYSVVTNIVAKTTDFIRGMKRAGDTSKSFTNNVKNGMENIDKSVKNVTQKVDNFGRQMSTVTGVINRNLKTVPEHLKPFSEELKKTSNAFRQMGMQSTQSLEEMAESITKTRVSASKLTSVSSTGKEAIKTIQGLADVSKEAQLAVLGLSKDGKVTISAEESITVMHRFQDSVSESKKELERLRDSGDMGSYTAGMRQLELQMNNVQKAMMAAGQGGDAYMSTLRRLGIYTESMGNAMAIQMEGMKDSFINSVDMMVNRSTQSEKIAKNFERMGNPLYSVNNGLLKISSGLETMARKGSAAALAIEHLGKNASMKDLLDYTRMINQGLMRMSMLFIGAGLAFAAFTAVMVDASKGEDVGKIRQQQEEITQIYQEEVQKRTDEIYNFANLFEEIEIKPFDPKKLTENLQSQVEVMKNWAKNLKSLTSRGVSEGFIAELEKMGPKAAGQIQALTTMTDSQLNDYVKLWEEKHRLAKEKAVGELEGLRIETEKKIQELEKSLTPLGISFENFKQTWASAVKPFVEVWGKVASVFVDGATKVGEFINHLNEINSKITQMAGMFLYLFTTLMVILSPLAVGIGMFGGLKAALHAVWLLIGPFVAGFATVAGTAALVAGAIVLLGFTLRELWNNSEQFRNAVTGAFDSIKSLVLSSIESLKQSFSGLGSSLLELISAFVGGDGTIQGIWKSLGDMIASVINFITSVTFPILKVQFGIVVEIIKGLVTILIAIFDEIRIWWQKDGKVVQDLVKISFSEIKKVIDFVAPYIKKLLYDTFEGIKVIIRGSTQIITGIISVFAGLLTGDFDRLKVGISRIIEGLFTVLKGLFQVSLINDVIAIVKKFGGSALSNISEFADKTVDKFTSIFNNVKTIFNNIKDAITSPIETAKSIVLGIITTIEKAFSKLKIDIPKPKLPHINVDFKEFGIGKAKVEVPTFGIDWYKKGGVFNQASIIGVGEERGVSEAVLPLKDSVLGKIGSMIANTMKSDFAQTAISLLTNDFNHSRIVESLSRGINQKQPQFASNQSENNNQNNVTLNNTFHFDVKGNLDEKEMRRVAEFVSKRQIDTLKSWGRI
jgi:phage-related protein